MSSRTLKDLDLKEMLEVLKFLQQRLGSHGLKLIVDDNTTTKETKMDTNMETEPKDDNWKTVQESASKNFKTEKSPTIQCTNR